MVAQGGTLNCLLDDLPCLHVLVPRLKPLPSLAHDATAVCANPTKPLTDILPTITFDDCSCLRSVFSFFFERAAIRVSTLDRLPLVNTEDNF
jgi:hypothetical protein